MYWMDYRIEVGEMAPDFRLDSTSGGNVRLYDYKNKNVVLLFFFDRFDERCLGRLKTLARGYEQFRDAGVAVLPISVLGVDEGRAIVEKHGLPFGILCDDDHSVTKYYHASRCSESPGHVCFEVIRKVEVPLMLVVDTSGIIRYKHAATAASPDNSTLLDECRKAFK